MATSSSQNTDGAAQTTSLPTAQLLLLVVCVCVTIIPRTECSGVGEYSMCKAFQDLRAILSFFMGALMCCVMAGSPCDQECDLSDASRSSTQWNTIMKKLQLIGLLI